MVQFYVDKIINGDMTLEQVPKLWNEKVRKALEEN